MFGKDGCRNQNKFEMCGWDVIMIAYGVAMGCDICLVIRAFLLTICFGGWNVIMIALALVWGWAMCLVIIVIVITTSLFCRDRMVNRVRWG